MLFKAHEIKYVGKGNNKIKIILVIHGFMCGVKRSIHVHCIVILSQVLLSQVGSLLFFVLFFMTQLVTVLHCTLSPSK